MRERKDKRKRIILFWVLLILLLLFFSGLAKICVGFKKSLAGFSYRVNFIFLDSQKLPLVFSLEGKEGQILLLPADLEVKVPGGFGTYKLGKIYGLGELEKREKQLLAETLRANLYLAIFSIFYDQRVDKKMSWQNPKNFLQQVFWQSLTGKIRTDLNKYDLLLLYGRTWQLNENLVKVVNLSEKTSFSDKHLGEESLALEVLNATDHNGLAQETAKFLEKAGVRVVRSADALGAQTGCEIKAKNEVALSYTLWWIKKFFPCKVVFGVDGSRADVTLILGEDYWKKLGKE